MWDIQLDISKRQKPRLAGRLTMEWSHSNVALVEPEDGSLAAYVMSAKVLTQEKNNIKATYMRSELCKSVSLGLADRTMWQRATEEPVETRCSTMSWGTDVHTDCKRPATTKQDLELSKLTPGLTLGVSVMTMFLLLGYITMVTYILHV